MSNSIDGLFEFFLYVGQAKRTFRTGWVLRGVERVESIADHMYRMSLMSFLLPNLSEESKIRCLKLSLIHDLAESAVGDLTNFDGITKEEKHRREYEAMTYLTSLLPENVGKEIFSLFDEYSKQETIESNLVKDLDLFDMLLQGLYISSSSIFIQSFHLAYEYEQIQDSDRFLEDFFSNSSNKIQSEVVRQWLKKLIDRRTSKETFSFPSDSNLKTILKKILYNDQGFSLHLISSLIRFDENFRLEKFLYNFPSNEIRDKSDRVIADLTIEKKEIDDSKE